MPNAPAPDPLGRVLNRLARRRRTVVLARGLGLALAIAALGGLVGIGLDLAFFLPQPARWLVWGAWLGSALLALGASAFRAYAQSPDLLALAARAERDDPTAAPIEALTAAVSLARSPHGSPALIAAVAQQAADLGATIEPSRIIPGGRAARRFAIGVCLLGLLMAPAVLAPAGPVRTGVRRFLAPWANLARPGAFAIAVEPGNSRAALGSRPTIRVEARALNASIRPPDDAWIEWREAQSAGPPRRLALSGDAGRFSVAMSRLIGPVVYRAVVGSGSDPGAGAWTRIGLDASTSASPWYRLDAVEPPRVVGLRVTVAPPSYLKRPATTISVEEGPATIEGWQDSRVTLAASADAPLGSLSVEFQADGTSRTVSHPATIAGDRRSASVVIPAESSGTLAISLVDDSGIAGEGGALHRLIVRVDAPPTVSAEAMDHAPGGDSHATRSASLDRSVEARPDDVVRIGLTMDDDVAVASAELRYEVERSGAGGAETGTGSRDSAVPVPLSAAQAQAQAEVTLDLGPLGLRPGDRLTYRARVLDNRTPPRGPNVAWSEPRSIAIVRRAESLAQRRRDAARAAVQAQLDAVKQGTAKLRQEAERLRFAADAARQGNGAWDADRQRALAGREADSGRLIGDLERLATLMETRTVAEADFHMLAPAARDAAGREGESSRAALGRARRARPEAPGAEPSEAAPKRLEALRQADGHLGELAARLDELQARFDATAPKGKPGQGGADPKSELASKDPAAKPGTGNTDEDGDGDPRQTRQGNGEKPGEASGTSQTMAGKRQAGRASEPGKPGGGSAPVGYPAAHEDAEPVSESDGGDLAALREALRSRTGRPWADLPGQLRSRILRMPQVKFRDEYSRQIEGYYRALAEPPKARGGRPDE